MTMLKTIMFAGLLAIGANMAMANNALACPCNGNAGSCDCGANCGCQHSGNCGCCSSK